MQSFKNAIKILFVMVFILVQGALYFSPAHAATANQATVRVIGQNGSGLQAETPETVDGSQTATDLLQSAAGPIGKDQYGMISTIKGITPTGDNYWAFYINDVSAQVGADSYKPKTGDHILFEYHPFTGTLNNEVAVVIPGSSYPTIFDVLVDTNDTLYSVLQKVSDLDKVSFDANNQLVGLDGKTADSTHSWSITEDNQGQKGPVNDITTAKVQGGEQFTFNLVEKQSTPTPTTNSGTTVTPITNEHLSNAINQASSYVLKNGVSEWEAVSLAKSGKTVPTSYLKQVTKTVEEAKGVFHSVTDTERYTLGILAAGGDPTNVGGYNLVKNIYNGDLTKQGLNGVLFGLIALNSADFSVPTNAKWTKTSLDNYILNVQNEDGGWAWDGSKTSDLDTTGMALTALSQSDSTTANIAVQKAAVYVAKQIKAGKLDNSSTAAQLIIGLASNDMDPNGVDYALQDGKTLMTYLLSFQQKDGGFDWQSKDESTFSTQQGFLALAADQQFLQHGSLYSFKWTPTKRTPVLASDSTKVSKPAKSTTVITTSTPKETGATLPQTATPFYNYLILGFFLILAGVSVRFMVKKGFN